MFLAHVHISFYFFDKFKYYKTFYYILIYTHLSNYHISSMFFYVILIFNDKLCKMFKVLMHIVNRKNKWGIKNKKKWQKIWDWDV